jgi:hemolysin III
MENETKFTRGEEVANAISHFAGAVMALVGTILMIRNSLDYGNGWHLASTVVFGASMILLYLSSTFTHILPAGRAKDRFFNFDRISIYLLIAGTYTPIALVTLNGPLGWVIFGIEWGFAIVGIIMILAHPGEYDTGVSTFYIVSYVIMGWVILIAIEQLLDKLPLMGTMWILIGGLSYSVGVLFFKVIKFPYHHLIWHILVITGTLSHFFAVFYFIIPRN